MASPLEIKEKATEIARKFRVEDDTNYDEAENRYDAMRHIGGAMMLYKEYPDMLANIMLDLNEEWNDFVAPMYGEEIGGASRKHDEHNNAIAAKLITQFDEESLEQMSDEDIMQFAREYVDSFRTDEEVDFADFGIDPELTPMYTFGDTKEK